MPAPKRKTNPKAARKAAAKKEEAFHRKGEELRGEYTTAMAGKLEQFKSNLEAFAANHKSKIAKDPIFRAQFNQMCRTIGVDPLQSKKGFWASLNLGDFYYELGIQCIKVCIQTREQNGGLIELEEMCRLLTRLRKAGSQSIGSDDVEAAVRTLKPLGSGYKILDLGAGRKRVIQSVPTELNSDHMSVLRLMEATGHTTEAEIMSNLSWSSDRIETALNVLLEEGMVWIDDQAMPTGQRWYWSMCFSNIDADATF